MLERAVARSRRINTSRSRCGNELDRDRARLDRTFIPQNVHVAAASVDQTHALRVDSRRAGRIITVVGGDGARCHDDQAGAGMRVPASTSSRRPHVGLDVHVRETFRLQLRLPESRDGVGVEVQLVESCNGEGGPPKPRAGGCEHGGGVRSGAYDDRTQEPCQFSSHVAPPSCRFVSIWCVSLTHDETRFTMRRQTAIHCAFNDSSHCRRLPSIAAPERGGYNRSRWANLRLARRRWLEWIPKTAWIRGRRSPPISSATSLRFSAGKDAKGCQSAATSMTSWVPCMPFGPS